MSTDLSNSLNRPSRMCLRFDAPRTAVSRSCISCQHTSAPDRARPKLIDSSKAGRGPPGMRENVERSKLGSIERWSTSTSNVVP